MESDQYYSFAIIDTNVCCYCAGNIIYVDKDANGCNNGTSWEDAYTLLQDGFTGARNCPGVKAIWVAEGTYKPVWETDASDAYKDESFELIDGVGVFGHFAGYEWSTSQRDFADANNETILEGQIGGEDYEAVTNIVTAESVGDSILDGFTVTGSYSSYYGSYDGSGIFLDYSDVGIANCKVKDNTKYGVYAVNFSNPDIHNCTFIENSSNGVKCDYSWPIISNCILDGNDITVDGVFASDSVLVMTDCTVKNHTEVPIYALSNTSIDINTCCVKNNRYGISCSDSYVVIMHCLMEHNTGEGLWCTEGTDLEAYNNVLRFNGEYGIYLEDSRTVSIKNNWIHNNGANDVNESGIFIKEQVSPPLIRNNTIVNNLPYGVYFDSGHEPNVVNCIIYDNAVQIETLSGEPLENVKYSCIEGGYDGTGNIDSDPNFMNPGEPNDLHIAGDSPCKNAGDPNGSYGEETDIDGEERIKYGRVDIGGDEYYWSPADYDHNRIVNFVDYAYLGAAWHTEDADISLDDDNDVDYADVALFCDDWLWQAGWSDGWMMCMGGGAGMLGFEGAGFVGGVGLESVKRPGGGDDLMLTDAKASVRAMPERLAERAAKFYSVRAVKTISLEQETGAVRIKSLDVKKLLEWLEKVWLDPEVQEAIDEETWRRFIESFKADECSCLD